MRPLLRRLSLHWNALVSLGAIGAVWSLLTYGHLVSPVFLPSPTEVVDALILLLIRENFSVDILVSTCRVMGGFVLSVSAAVPLGVWIGSSRSADLLLTPLLNFIRYMPAPAFIPLLILWFGIGITLKIALLFISVFFYLTSLVAEAVKAVDNNSIESALTLGATRPQAVFRVIVPSAYPAIWQSMRIMMGVAWTSIVMVELLAAETGIGSVIIRSQRFLQTPKLVAGILTIGLLGILFDTSFRLAHRVLFPWCKDAEVKGDD